MLNLLKWSLFVGVLIAAFPIHSLASPAQSTLLPLIPHEARIVAGIEDPRNPDTRGHLLLVTKGNTFDFDDFQSLTGVDMHRGVDEAIWVAAPSPQGALNGHLLLVAGHFDRAHIFQAAEQNGFATTVYRNLEVMLVKPFPREAGQLQDLRWMAILDGRTVVFGSPRLVQKALDRSIDHEPADPQLAARLDRLHPQVSSWTILVTPRELLPSRADIGQAPWVDLLGRETLDAAEELTLGIRFGSTARVDFIVQTARPVMSAGAAGLAGQRLFESSSFRSARPRLEGLTIEQNLIRGSILLPGKQLDACFKSATCGESAVTLRADK